MNQNGQWLFRIGFWGLVIMAFLMCWSCAMRYWT